MPTYVRSVTDKFHARTAFPGKSPSYAKLTALANQIKTFIPALLALSLSSKLQYLNYGHSRTTILATGPFLPGWKMTPESRKGTTT